MQEERSKIPNSPAEWDPRFSYTTKNNMINRDKFQMTNSKQISSDKFQTLNKYFFLFRIWDLNIIWSLVLGICDFSVRSEGG
ncbi:MAG: hypothetical protein WBB67_13150 [bacterium]